MLGNAGKFPVIQSRKIVYFKSFHLSESREMMMMMTMMIHLGSEFFLLRRITPCTCHCKLCFSLILLFAQLYSGQLFVFSLFLFLFFFCCYF